MPNRIIKESICYSDDIDNLTSEEEVFFYRIIVNCDDYGIMDARPKMIKSKCFPLKDIKDKHIEDWLMKLWKSGLILLYANDSKRYLMMSKWEKHQQIRAKRSKHPLPTDEGSEILQLDSTCNQLISNDGICPRNPIQSESNPNLNPNLNTNTSNEVNKNIIPYDEIFELYNQQNVIKHKALTKKMKEAIKATTTKNGIDNVKMAIIRYGTMYHDNSNPYSKGYCNYKWTLEEFLTRDKALSEFLDEGGKWIRYNEGANSYGNNEYSGNGKQIKDDGINWEKLGGTEF